jgi:hypothetical protein
MEVHNRFHGVVHVKAMRVIVFDSRAVAVLMMGVQRIMVVHVAMALRSRTMRMAVEKIPAADPGNQHANTNHQNKETGYQSQIPMQAFFGKTDSGRGYFGCNSQQDNAKSVGQGDHQSQNNRIDFSSPGTDQIGRYHGFSVARLKGVQSA